MSTMTDEQLRVRIAEACGWKPYSPGDFNPTQRWINSVHEVRTLDGFLGNEDHATVLPLPHYQTSLDAIQSAVLSMPVEFQLRFNDAFHKHFGRRFNGGFVQFTWQLTARDWCEAFVAALEP